MTALHLSRPVRGDAAGVSNQLVLGVPEVELVVARPATLPDWRIEVARRALEPSSGNRLGADSHYRRAVADRATLFMISSVR